MARRKQSKQLGILCEPQCLIGAEDDGQLFVPEGVLDDLRQLDKPCVVVAIAGLYRTGKSYLMNRLAGHTDGFALGSTIQSKTKGIWVWARDHPVLDNHYLVLLDTEGLGDAEKGDQNHDNWIFCLATLLSSQLVYNALGVINEDALAKLTFITEMSKHIRTHNSKDDNGDSEFDWYFPDFAYVLRDFTLACEIDGREVTPDQYLEHCLTLKKGDDARTNSYNHPRECIRKYFKKRKCFTFDRPAGRRTLAKLESVPDKELSVDFVEEVTQFCDYMFQKAPVKKVDTGQPFNGRMLGCLIQTYIQAIRDGAVPCVENAVEAMARTENTRAIEKGMEMYQSMMSEVEVPTPDNKTLSEAHVAAVEKAVEYFLGKAVFDHGQTYQIKLNGLMDEAYKVLKEDHIQASVKKSRKVLMSLYGAYIEGNMKSGQYAQSGGFKMYLEDRKKVQSAYDKERGLGTEMNAVYLAFIAEKDAEADAVMKADEKVTLEEKKAEDERRQALRAEEEKERVQKQAEADARKHEEQIAIFKQNTEQLIEAQRKEIESINEKNQEMLEKRLQEQARLMEEGRLKDAEKFQKQIDDQKAENDKCMKEAREQQEKQAAMIEKQSAELEAAKSAQRGNLFLDILGAVFPPLQLLKGFK